MKICEKVFHVFPGTLANLIQKTFDIGKTFRMDTIRVMVMDLITFSKWIRHSKIQYIMS